MAGSEDPGATSARAGLSPALGESLDGRYRLRREIALGGGARVVEGEHVLTRRAVAVKLPRPGDAAHSVAVARLRREIEALALARQPGVVDLLDAGEVGGLPYLVLELVPGRTLAGLLASRGTLGLRETVALALELAWTLHACHERGIVHRDVKPSNVMVLPEPASGGPRTRLLDFGIAQLGARPDGGAKLTAEGAVLGTPEYMAPEALLSLPTADHRVDVYALGVTLYECLTGTVPHEGRYGEVLLKHSTGAIPPLRERRIDAPRELAEAVHRALASDPADRFQSVAELYDALAALPELIDLPRPPPLPTTGRGPDVTVAGTPASLRASDAGRGPTGGASRRQHARAPYVTPARVVASGGARDGRTEEVSEGGLLFVGAEGYASGTAARLRFALPVSGRIIEVDATARWTRTARSGTSTGFEFSGLSDDARADLRHYVAYLAPQGPPSPSRAPAGS
ncbi:MAG: protein kinase [Polyangiaceae bacterium]|nr:protein kinase [Polyangiaceae bacterium]